MKKTTTLIVILSSSAVAFAQSAPRQAGAGNGGAARQEKSAVAGNAGSAPVAQLGRSNDPNNDAFQQSGGSLYHMTTNSGSEEARAEANLFSVPKPDPKRLKKHDLITVIVREESSGQTKATTDTKKTADFNAILQQYAEIRNFGIHGKATPAIPPQLQFQADRNFKGEGTVDRTDSMTARVQAEIVDVKPNGTLVVQAQKQIKMDDEEIRFTLTGVVRAEDVTIDNSVLSTQLADLNLEKATKGAARDVSKRGWVVKFFDAINPF